MKHTVKEPYALELCAFARIVDELENPQHIAQLSPRTLCAALDEATELALRAFEKNEQPVLHYVERLLYVIHARTNFAPPSRGLAAIIWPVLMDAKLKQYMRPYCTEPELSAEQMADILQRAVAEADERDHSLLEELAAAEGMQGLVVYTKNWYGSTHGFNPQLIGIVQRCAGKRNLKPALFELLENLNEEYGDNDGAHPELRSRWPKRIGLQYSPEASIEDEEQLTESFALQNFRTGISTLSDPMYALGSFYTIEANFPGVCKRMYPALHRRGFEDDCLITFKKHWEADEDHSREFLEALVQSPISPQERVRVVNGGLAQIRIRSQMFDAMREYLGYNEQAPRAAARS